MAIMKRFLSTVMSPKDTLMAITLRTAITTLELILVCGGDSTLTSSFIMKKSLAREVNKDLQACLHLATKGQSVLLKVSSQGSIPMDLVLMGQSATQS
jgi:hypothetical protein